MRTVEKNSPNSAPTGGAAAEMPMPCYPPQTAQDVVNNLKNTDAQEVHLDNLHDLFTEWVVTTQLRDDKGKQSAFFTYYTLRSFIKDETCCTAVGLVDDIAHDAEGHLESLEDMFTELMAGTRWMPERRQQIYQTYLAMREVIKSSVMVSTWEW